MEVDLLRPGTIPIAPETVLWFEFLLDKDLLIKHLQKENSEPTAVELITKFYDVISETIRNKPENENLETIRIDPVDEIKSKSSAKNLALKVLALKIIAYLKFNLVQLRSLPFKTQINLLQDLIFFTNENVNVELPNIEFDSDKLSNKPFLFALIIYHRWLLNTTIHRITPNWQLRFGLNEMSTLEETIFCSQENIDKTLLFLNDCLSWTEIPGMLTFDCFQLPTETNDKCECDWTKVVDISKEELFAQINYDLATFYFYREDYVLAKEKFAQCLKYYNSVENINGFLDLDEETLTVYVKACNCFIEGSKGNLLEQLNSSIVNQYKGITTILQQDNILKEIPLSRRINVELDIQGAMSSGVFTVERDLMIKIRSLNVVRCWLDRKPLYHYSVSTFKEVEAVIKTLLTTWRQFSPGDKYLIKKYLMELILKNEVPELLPMLQSCEIGKIFDKGDLQYIKSTEVRVKIPQSLNSSRIIRFEFSNKRKKTADKVMSHIKNLHYISFFPFKQVFLYPSIFVERTKVDLRHHEQQLISTYDHKEVRELLVKIAKLNLGVLVWRINPQWELPIPLTSVIKSLMRGFLQDFAFILLAKSREQMLSKNWNSALELLIILEKELTLHAGNEIGSKLYKLVNWEILLIQIMQYMDEWPRQTIDKNALANACEACLQNNESILPRIEIKEQCVICLMNLGRWDYLVNYDKRWTTFEITSALALACQEMVKHKGNKNFSKNLWDLVVPIFANQPFQSKRNNTTNNFHESHLTALKVNIMSIFSKLRDSVTLTVVISLLTKLLNILRDESTLELQVEYINQWPDVISNAKSFNTTAVNDVLSDIVTGALELYPLNASWLRLMGDINFANNHYNISMSYYLKCLLICNDYFNIPVRNDDHVFRRMIKCCTALGCHTQAAVLCQFFDKPDYLLAFRILGDQKICNDAVDAYYHCFWDTNILEFLIHIHHKKGEFQRRKCAVQVIGLLELSSNNNEEIQREASNLRKSIFLRALCKQYVF